MKFHWQLALAATLALFTTPHSSLVFAQDAAGQAEEAAESAEEAADDELTDVEKIEKSITELRSRRPSSLAELREMQASMLELAEKLIAADKEKKSEMYGLAIQVVTVNKAQSLAQLKGEEREKALNELKETIMADGPTIESLRLAMPVAQSIERSDAGAEAAAAVYNDFAAFFKKSDDERIQQAAQMMEGSARRLTLPGSELKLSGLTFEGKDFDISSLKGKVVLVDFWATWCGPCIREYPNMLKNYEGYHDKGFEIVGVSLDQDREALAEYLEDKNVPWITLHGKDGDNYGHNDATDYYGVVGIPTMFLLDKEGKVVSTAARGPELTRLLKDMLGEPAAVEEDGAEEAPEEESNE